MARASGTVLALAIVTSACRVTAGFGTGSQARPPAARAATHAETPRGGMSSVPPPGGPRSETSSDPAREAKIRAGIISQAEMESLIGLTPDGARLRLRELGHTAPITINELEAFDPRCKSGRVCETSAPGGTFIDREIELRVNRTKLEIAPPPP